MTTETLDLFSGGRWLLACLFLLCIGAIGVVIGFVVAPLASWLWLLVAFLTFLGIGSGMLAWVAAFRVAQARWTPAIYRVAESAIAFVPVQAILLVILLAGAFIYMPWAVNPVPAKQWWLNIPAFVVREALLLGIFWALMFFVVRLGLKADADSSLADPSNDRFHHKLNALAAAAAAVYGIAFTVVAWDFIMSLSPEWISTAFGAYYFCTNIYAGMAMLVLLCTAALRSEAARNYLKPQQFKDMGNLMLAFSLFDMGLFFAQYLTIWYENLPVETGFLLVRYMYGGWPWLGWAALIVGYAIPFVLLQSRYIKTHPKPLSWVAAIALMGFALERYVLVMPSLWPTDLLPFPAMVLMLPGLAGAFILCVRWFTHRYPAVSSAQDALKQVHERKAVHIS